MEVESGEWRWGGAGGGMESGEGAHTPNAPAAAAQRPFFDASYPQLLI